MIINKIQKNKLYLSTEEVMDTSPLIRQKYNLKVGSNIKNIYEDISYESSFEKAIYLISLKDRTKKEIFLKLKEKYRSVSSIERVIEKLEELGFINDLNYSIAYIKNKKYGRARINYMLYQKGINKEIVDEAYNYIEQNEIDYENKSIEDEKLEKLLIKNIKKDEKKLIQYLLRQGFSLNKILEKLKEYKK